MKEHVAQLIGNGCGFDCVAMRFARVLPWFPALELAVLKNEVLIYPKSEKEFKDRSV